MSTMRWKSDHFHSIVRGGLDRDVEDDAADAADFVPAVATHLFCDFVGSGNQSAVMPSSECTARMAQARTEYLRPFSEVHRLASRFQANSGCARLCSGVG